MVFGFCFLGMMLWCRKDRPPPEIVDLVEIRHTAINELMKELKTKSLTGSENRFG